MKTTKKTKKPTASKKTTVTKKSSGTLKLKKPAAKKLSTKKLTVKQFFLKKSKNNQKRNIIITIALACLAFAVILVPTVTNKIALNDNNQAVLGASVRAPQGLTVSSVSSAGITISWQQSYFDSSIKKVWFEYVITPVLQIRPEIKQSPVYEVRSLNSGSPISKTNFFPFYKVYRATITDIRPSFAYNIKVYFGDSKSNNNYSTLTNVKVPDEERYKGRFQSAYYAKTTRTDSSTVTHPYQMQVELSGSDYSKYNARCDYLTGQNASYDKNVLVYKNGNKRSFDMYYSKGHDLNSQICYIEGVNNSGKVEALIRVQPVVVGNSTFTNNGKITYAKFMSTTSRAGWATVKFMSDTKQDWYNFWCDDYSGKNVLNISLPNTIRSDTYRYSDTQQTGYMRKCYIAGVKWDSVSQKNVWGGYREVTY